MCDSTCIVNADDFGYSSDVNSAVVQSFENKWVSSATIMVNMPAFDEACEIVDRYDLHNHVGLHFVLTEGIPLTDGIKRQHRFCDDCGRFRKTREKRILRLSARENKAVRDELRMQIKRCRRNGLKITHIDSHHNIHEEIGIMSLIIPLMREFGIPHIRIMNNMAESNTVVRSAYTAICNKYLKYRRLSRTDYFGSIDQYVTVKKKCSGITASRQSFEIMTHPVLNDRGVIIDALSKRPMGQLIEDAGLRYSAKSFCDATYDR